MTHPHPSVRVCAYLACGGRGDDTQVLSDRALLLSRPPVSEVLAAQYPEGYWMHRDLGISPRYRATVWQLLILAQLGVGPVAAPDGAGAVALPDSVRRAVAVVHTDNVAEAGALRLRQDEASPALTGAVLWAVARLGATHVGDWAPTWAWVDARVAATDVAPAAAVWITRAAIAWGMHDWPAARMPWGDIVWPRPSEARLIFPLALQPDLPAMMEMACEIGRPDLVPDTALAWLRARRRPDGTWPLEHSPGPLWCDVGAIGAANPWVTVRALSVLGCVERR